MGQLGSFLCFPTGSGLIQFLKNMIIDKGIFLFDLGGNNIWLEVPYPPPLQAIILGLTIIGDITSLFNVCILMGGTCFFSQFSCLKH